MTTSRKQKASFNIISSSVMEIVNVLNAFIIPRLILRTYGSSYNGIASSVAQFLSLISLLQIGVTASTRVALYRSLADNDIHKTSAIVRAAEQYMRKIGVVLAVYIVVLSFVYPLVVKTGFQFWEVSSLVLIIGISSFAEYFFGITYATFLLADQCLYISNLFTMAATLLNLGLTVVLIRAGYSIQIVKLGSAAVFALKPALQNLYVTRKYHLNKHCEPDMSALKNRRDTAMHALANIVHDKTDLIVLTLFTDVKTVSVYTVYNLIVAALSKAQNIFSSGTEPIFGNMWAKGEYNKIRINLGIYEHFVAVLSSLLFSVAYVMILPFVSLYTKNISDVNYIRPIYAGVILLAAVIFACRTPYLALVQGAGHYRQTRNAAIIEAAINMTLSVFLVLVIPLRDYKMVGVAIGTLAANLFRTVQYAIYIDNNIVQRGKHIFILKIIWTLLNICLSAFPAYMVTKNTSIDTWGKWIICSFCVGIFSIITTFLSSILFYRTDTISAFQIILSIIKRKLPRK